MQLRVRLAAGGTSRRDSTAVVTVVMVDTVDSGMRRGGNLNHNVSGRGPGPAGQEPLVSARAATVTDSDSDHVAAKEQPEQRRP
jgi:hypothetical protein